MTHFKQINTQYNYLIYISINLVLNTSKLSSFPVAQLVEHGASNAKIMGSAKIKCKTVT